MIMLHALDCGADDVSAGEADDQVVLTCEANQLSEVVNAMQGHGYTILHADQHWVADMMQALDEAATEKMMVLYDALIELDDVQSVFTNADLGQTFID